MRKMMKCAAAWVLAFAVALTAVPVSYAEDSTGNPEAEYTVPYEAVEEENAVDQESQNDLAGQAQQNPDSVNESTTETEADETLGGAGEEDSQQQTPSEEEGQTENPAAESEEQTQPAEEAQAEAVQQQTETDVQEKATPETEQEAVLPELTYRTHVQDIG